jgi:hypothetical protein
VFYGAFVTLGRMKPSSMPKPVAKLNHAWITQSRRRFPEFLRVSDSPEVQRNGVRGSVFEYPESLIMLIAVLSVKCEEKTYLGIHRMTCRYWSVISPDKNLRPISESQLRERLKKICHTSRRLAAFILQLFPQAVID